MHLTADDFARPVYCLLGVPVDAVDMAAVADRIVASAESRQRFFLSTPNLNFITLAQRDEAFRRSLLASDMCPVDGMGALYLCRKLGIPVSHRVAGSDIPAALENQLRHHPAKKISMAFFGGEPGIAQRACSVLNAAPEARLRAVGGIEPGILSTDGLRDPAHQRELNAMQADFLLVALGAQKGQAWIMANLQALETPVISHLGATINFIAGNVARAPAIIQKAKLEWLWRIKEEPRLASRYYQDAKTTYNLLASRVRPMARWLAAGRMKHEGSAFYLQTRNPRTLLLTGAATNSNLEDLRDALRGLAEVQEPAVLDASGLQFFDLHFAGLLLMLDKALGNSQGKITIINASAETRRALTLAGLGNMVKPN